MNNENCPCCPNHCSKDNLSCGRGRDFYNSQDDNNEAKSLNEQVIMDLRKCGHLLHHNRELTSEELLSNFSEEELNNLHELLFRIHSNIKEK